MLHKAVKQADCKLTISTVVRVVDHTVKTFSPRQQSKLHEISVCKGEKIAETIQAQSNPYSITVCKGDEKAAKMV